MPWTYCSIGRQSCTASRTSPSTVSSAATIAAQVAASIGSTWIWMKLSRLPPAAAAPKAISLPPSRRASNTGCATSRTSSLRSAISPITEFDQERHVVIADFDHRDRFALARMLERHRLAANLGCARLAVFQIIVGAFGERERYLPARNASRRPPPRAHKERDEILRDVAAATGKRLAGAVDDGAGGGVDFVTLAFGGGLIEHGYLALLSGARSVQGEGASCARGNRSRRKRSFHLPNRSVESNTPFGDGAMKAVRPPPLPPGKVLK